MCQVSVSLCVCVWESVSVSVCTCAYALSLEFFWCLSIYLCVCVFACVSLYVCIGVFMCVCFVQFIFVAMTDRHRNMSSCQLVFRIKQLTTDWLTLQIGNRSIGRTFTFTFTRSRIYDDKIGGYFDFKNFKKSIQ